ncbi:MAG: tRNA lysidine(34) synthetase TilS, partial [Dehalococcoidia bacterium]
TASDQAETVLMHIVRGSGLDGLAGMKPRSPWPFGDGPALVRPLLGVRREESERYCRELGVTPRQDPSNLLLEATRNRIRHQLLPLLRQLNPAVEESLLRLAQAAAEHVRDLEGQADALWPALAQEGEGAVTFPRDAMAGLAPAMAARLLRRAARQLTGGAGDREAVHVRSLLEGLAKRRTRLTLRRGLVFVVRGPSVRLALGGGGLGGGAAPIPSTPLAVPGRTDLPGWTVEARFVRRPRSPRAASPFEAYLDAEAVGRELSVRGRRPGDRLRPLGLGGEKKVQDILVDAKVSAEERDAVPIVCSAWGVAWVVGHRIDERAAVGEGTRRVLWLRFVSGADPERP